MSSQRKVKKIGDTGSNENSLERGNNDEEIQKALEEVDSCQDEIDALNAQASDEILKIEQKYNLLRNPLYSKRNDLINKIPHFWVTAFANHPDLSALLSDSDEDCLHHMTKIEIEDYDDIKSGYKIHFYFEENPYFENQVLTKDYHLASITEPISTSTEIKWKDGYNLTQDKHTQSKTSRKRAFEQKTFFAWFTDHSDPVSDDVAEAIKDDLWINPISYFLLPDSIDNGVDDDEGSDQDEENDDGEDATADNTDEDMTDVQNSVQEESSNA
ncbi:protein SET [Onthophagus taurus]|uniref:protein SET n=1 Tax=Onthophagus taurus TaxID=166361 RepID=UPI000C207669|nr:protein SET [Onthophagus taurus]